MSARDKAIILAQVENKTRGKRQALMALGISNPGEVLDALAKESKSNPNTQLLKALQRIREVARGNGRG